MRAKKKNNSKKNWIRTFIIVVVIVLLLLLLSDLRLLPRRQTTEKTTPIAEDTSSLASNVYNNSDNDSLALGEPMIIMLGNNSSDYIITLNSNQPVQKLGEESMQETESSLSQEEQEEQLPARASEVEFYFLLKNKFYFKHMLKEGEERLYNLSGNIVIIQPIIITQDKAKFKINNYTTKALAEDEWGSGKEFEIMVKSIYYRR